MIFLDEIILKVKKYFKVKLIKKNSKKRKKINYNFFSEEWVKVLINLYS